MIIVKIVNQRVIQVALTTSGHQQFGNLLARKYNKKLGNISFRTLVQSSTQSQKVTSANNQQLIPVARNISFRRCQSADLKKVGQEKASYSISSNYHGESQFSFGGEIEPYIVIGEQEAAIEEQRESPLEALKRRAKDARDRREVSSKSKYYRQIFNEAVPATSSERRLVVLLSWLEAKEKHIEKYRQFYLDRGFDVLNVKTTPLDLLLPNLGSKKISEDFVRFMTEKQYSNVVLHGFSVGGYMFGRFLLEIEKLDQEARVKLLNSIKGLVFDSLVPIEGTSYGVANSITENKFLAKMIENMINFYLWAGYNIATKYYQEVSEKVWAGPVTCPTLFFMSKDDKVSDFTIVDRLFKTWSDLGIDCQKMVVDSSPHVQLFTKHHEQYKKRVTDFLEHIKVV